MSMTPYEALDFIRSMSISAERLEYFGDADELNEVYSVLRSAFEWHTEPLEVGAVVLWSHKSWPTAKEGYLTGNGSLKVWGGEYHRLKGLCWTYLPTPPEG